ncbi:MAG: site-specific integrase, partial [Saprospiraceae bacterium]
MGVQLRKRKNQDGSTSLYMDIYNNGRRYYDFLDHLKLLRANNPMESAANSEKLKLAKQIVTKKLLELQS